MRKTYEKMVELADALADSVINLTQSIQNINDSIKIQNDTITKLIAKNKELEERLEALEQNRIRLN